MDRLTETGKVFTFPKIDTAENSYLERVQNRLAAYEDTGLEPEEIVANMEMFAAYRHVCGGRPPEEIAALVKARDEGRVVVLPVPKGSTVYRVLHYSEHKCQGRMKGRTVAASTRIHRGVMQWEDAPNWGKTVFLTRAEAEAAIGGGGDG